MCYAVPQPMYFSWQYAIRYHNQSILPSNVWCGTTTNARWKALVVELHVTLPCVRHYLWYRMTHCQVRGTGRGTVWHNVSWNTLVVVPHSTYQCISPDNVSYGTMTSAFYLAMFHAVPRPVQHSNISKHIASWNTLVMVPHSTLPGEIHWLWYRIAHCQVKYIGCSTA
jgi:hypothetical protein